MGKEARGRKIMGGIVEQISEKSQVGSFLLETDLIWNISPNSWHLIPSFSPLAVSIAPSPQDAILSSDQYLRKLVCCFWICINLSHHLWVSNFVPLFPLFRVAKKTSCFFVSHSSYKSLGKSTYSDAKSKHEIYAIPSALQYANPHLVA